MAARGWRQAHGIGWPGAMPWLAVAGGCWLLYGTRYFGYGSLYVQKQSSPAAYLPRVHALWLR
jgi:hypothetical protein